MLRLFAGLDPGRTTKQSLNTLCYGIENARWVHWNNMHVTLRFIGETLEYKRIVQALDEIDFHPFEISVRGVGIFSNKDIPHTLYATVEESEDLSNLQALIEKKLREIGLPLDKRAFHPHITLARLDERAPGAQIADFLTRHVLYTIPSMKIEDFSLYSSKRRDTGSEYTIEQSFALT